MLGLIAVLTCSTRAPQDSEEDKNSQEDLEDVLQRDSTLSNAQIRAGGQLNSLSSRSLSSASFTSARVSIQGQYGFHLQILIMESALE